MSTVKNGYFVTNIQIIPLASLILGVQEDEEPLARRMFGGPGAGGGRICTFHHSLRVTALTPHNNGK